MRMINNAFLALTASALLYCGDVKSQDYIEIIRDYNRLKEAEQEEKEELSEMLTRYINEKKKEDTARKRKSLSKRIKGTLLEIRDEIDVYDGENAVYSASQEEGEKRLKELAFKHEREDAYVFVHEKDAWIDVGKGYVPLRRKNGKKSAMHISLNLADILQKLSYVAEEGDTVTLYHFHPDPDFSLKDPDSQRRAIRMNIPSADDYGVHTNFTPFLRSSGYKVSPSRVVGCFATFEYSGDRSQERNLKGIILKNFEDIFRKDDNHEENLREYFKKLKDEELYLGIAD